MKDERRTSHMESKQVASSESGNPWKWAFIVLVGFVIVGVLAFIGGRYTGNVVSDNPQPIPTVVKDVSIDDDAILGDKDAPVTIISFSDDQCPFCRKFSTETLPLIKKDYIDTGKVRFVLRDFPYRSILQLKYQQKQLNAYVKRAGMEHTGKCRT